MAIWILTIYLWLGLLFWAGQGQVLRKMFDEFCAKLGDEPWHPHGLGTALTMFFLLCVVLWPYLTYYYIRAAFAEWNRRK